MGRGQVVPVGVPVREHNDCCLLDVPGRLTGKEKKKKKICRDLFLAGVIGWKHCLGRVSSRMSIFRKLIPRRLFDVIHSVRKSIGRWDSTIHRICGIRFLRGA